MADYKNAYLREKKARKEAETVLEQISREMYLLNNQLREQYERMISEHQQKTLLLQVSRYSQEVLKLSELLPDLIDGMLQMSGFPLGTFDYFPIDRERENYRSPFFVNENTFEGKGEGKGEEKGEAKSTFMNIVNECLDDINVDVIFSREDVYVEKNDPRLRDKLITFMDENCLQGLFTIPVVANEHVAAIIHLFVHDEGADNRKFMDLFSFGVGQLGVLIEHRYNQDELESNYYQLQSMVRELGLAQKQLLQSEKMASVGQLSAGIAHEINNPMGYVKSNVNCLKNYQSSFSQGLMLAKSIMEEPDAQNNARFETFWQDNDISFLLEDSEKLLGETQQGISRVISIVSGLKRFARASDDKWDRCCVNDCVNEALKLSHNALKYKATVHQSLSEVPDINANAGELTQVFLNLLVNAGQAIDDNGEIEVVTRLNEGMVEVLVRDNGRGIDKENQEKIFDPFFTTKEVGEGTGLGLSISFGIVDSHHGTIMVESVPEGGTAFVVRLPVAVKESL